ncbi:MAG: hypothetical protein ACXWUL_10025, partial [Caldimonas sp.]
MSGAAGNLRDVVRTGVTVLIAAVAAALATVAGAAATTGAMASVVGAAPAARPAADAAKTASMAIVMRDQTALRAAPRDSAPQQAVLWQGEVIEVRGERLDY